MALFDFPRWKLTSPAAESGVVAPDERLSAGQTLVMGVQHAVAMFGATVLMPLLMGLDPNLSILMSGVGTLLFFVVTGGRVPSYLGSSAAFVGVVIAITGFNGQGLNPHLSVALGGIIACGLVYTLIGLVVMKIGRNLPRLRAALKAAGRLEDAWLVEHGTMPGERVRRLAEVARIARV